MKYEIIPISRLIPLERVFPSHLKNLENMINDDGFVLKAIIADKMTGMVLDGSHRYVYFLKNGFSEVPVHWVDYDSEDVRVGTHLRHRFLVEGGKGISKKECRDRACSGNLFQPRTTRHFFAFRKSDITPPLGTLKRCDPVEISDLICNTDVSREIAHNEMYIQEINEEAEIIIQYLSEISQTKQYLMDQIMRMDKEREVAFFPGKFHPPHIGHLQTILSILPKYKKLIVGVSEHRPSDGEVTTPDNILSTLSEFFGNFSTVEFVKIKGVLIEKTSAQDLPNFDVLLSGNPEVLDWADKVGLKSKFIARSEGLFFSGTEIRNLLKERTDEGI